MEQSPQTSASALSRAPIGQSTHGVVKVIGDALGEVSLRADQRTQIEKLAADAEARHAPLADAHKDLLAALADQIEKGAIDRAALQPRIAKVTADLEKSRAEDRAALVQLHGLLDKTQRNELVDALEKQMKAKHGHGGEHGDQGKLGHLGRLKDLADELKLTDDQRAKIHDAVKESMHDAKNDWKARGEAGHERGEGGAEEHHGGKHHRGGGKARGHGAKHALEAFREDTLDLDKAAPPHDMKAMASFGTERIAAFAEKVLPLLTPEQRKIAADKVRAMAASGDDTLLGH